MGLRFEILVTVGQIISIVITLALSRHEKPHAPLRPWLIGYLSGCVATLPLFYWLFPFRHQGVVSVFQEMQLGRLTLSFKRCHGSATIESSPAQVNNRLGIVLDLFRIMLYFYFITWFVLGCIWISEGSSRADAPKLYWSAFSFVIMCGLGYAVSFGFLLAALLCCCPCLYCPCLISLLALVGLVDTPPPPPPQVTFTFYP